jgi:deoxyribose-phosphate aldolase
MIANYIDHTLLSATATEADIHRLCAEARMCEFAAICINPLHVALVANELRETDIRIASVVGFPLGATTTAVKIAEVRDVLAAGANEIDMVGAIGLLKGGAIGRYRDDIAAIVEVIRTEQPDTIIKVILEMGVLTKDEKIMAAHAAVEAGADFVKTSTGMGGGGATVDDVKLLKATVPGNIFIKASGGIRSLAQARAMIAAGATRLGTSSGVTLVREEHQGGAE